ncbi:phosphopeptide-binding protein [Humibacillus sp. DSM 29435]|uniref:FHA domain-containing protein n=1 Tax=Humibacillus sp. DSM 29435 TaxID=1869167 RepID=UPI00087268F4|nr:FHA domain-containing protein [Humibacillus sp. DSM 29435]OFE18810.1 phosphopeptide-binding protein [Humibacillus sp. DSM 29435]
MSAVCPNGHTSGSDDYCDTCGSPIDAAAQSSPATPGSAPADPTVGASGSAGAGGSKSSLDLDPVPAPHGGAASPVAGASSMLSCPNCHTENAEGALFCEACGYDFTTGAMPRDPSAPAAGSGGGIASGADPATGDPAAANPAASEPPEPPNADPANADPASSSDPGHDPGTEPDAEDGTSKASAASTPAAATAGAGTGEPSPAASAFTWLAEVWIDPDWYQTQEADDPCPSPGLPMIMPLRHKSVLLGRVSTSKNTNPEIDLSSDPGVSRRHAQLTTDGTRWFVEDLGSSNGTFVGPASGPLPVKAVSVGPKTELDDDDRLYVGAWTRVVVRRATPDEVEAYA